MIIGIIGAMDSEMANLIEGLENKNTKTLFNQTFYEAKLNNHQVIATTCGIGKVNSAISTTLLINEYQPDIILNVGIAGGAIGLATADILIAREFIYSDFDTTVFGYEYGQVPGMPKSFKADSKYIETIKTALDELQLNYKEGIVLTGDKFMSSKKDIINNITSTYATEMEGASIAHACYRMNVPFASIRIISDILDSENHIADYSAFEKEASALASNIALKVINILCK